MFDDGPDVNEEALIEEKTEFEKTFILKHRSIFSESLSPNRFIKAPLWKLVSKITLIVQMSPPSIVSNPDRFLHKLSPNLRT